MFMNRLPDKVTDELTIILKQVNFDENEEIFKQGEVSNKIFILAQGTIELYLNISEGELYLDTIEEAGCVMNQVSVLTKTKLTYCTRAKTDVELLTISYEDLMKYKNKSQMQSLSLAIDEFENNYIPKQGLNDKAQLMYFLDYQRIAFPKP